ncbi:uncharacterized protein BJ212DRAFT_1299062 [Suillus subaureus]|uniref:Nephrocystin 3-like N-terminal domain-containing protein n=1 Tax=Suillus subaureus TaxID=48587 RepID=A0A9P7JDX1_9AGAM|nr:uncharacterized protein BJ212DRAFT_1299062 [Suillus subaureus]KAG1817504.1 hypothetical protein BJ212DRAFT_1299062 [Suillus subaureus]
MSHQRVMIEDAWEKLSRVSVKGAEYDSRERQPHPRRLEGSWIDLTNCIHALLGHREKSQLIWLHGAAGVGKSAVAFNIAERMRIKERTDIEKRLAGSFVFSRKHTKRSTTGYFFATLAYQLASISSYSGFKELATGSILENPALLDPDKSLRDQMEALFLRPLRRLRYRLGNCPPLVFVVDALHECTSKAELADLITLLTEVLREPQLPVMHILLTSNSQTHIREAFQNAEARPLLSEIRASTSGDILAMDVASLDSRVTGNLPHILAINTEPRNACITGDLLIAEELLMQEIRGSGVNNYQSYANRSFVMARKNDWDHALQDALESVSLHPSLTGYISKGIALCGKNNLQDAIRAFDLASCSRKAVALFNGNQHEDAMLRVQELGAICPKTDTLACRVVEAYLCVLLGTNALDGGRHSEAADHFTAAVKASAFTSQMDIYSKYQDFVVLFGWDLESLWKNANQRKCDALLRAGRLGEAVESHRYMMEISDEAMKASCLEWSTGKSSLISPGLSSSRACKLAFMRKCNALYAANGVVELATSGDAAFAEKDYDRAIELYSAAIELDSATDTIFANRSKARLLKCYGRMHFSMRKRHGQVIELNPSAYLGYQLKHEALHGAQCYDEAVEAFQIMLLKLDEAPDPQIQKLYQHCISPFEAENAIRQVLHAHLDNAPLRLINTSDGWLCDREAQTHAFKTSAEYKELLASIIKNAEVQLEHIQDVVAKYFRWVMLSHRWGEKEPLLHDIQDKVVYELDPVDSTTKLQSFCEITRDAGFYGRGWTRAASTRKQCRAPKIGQLHVCLVSQLSTHNRLSIGRSYFIQSCTLARSAWNKRGWTVQEFLAPKVILFYRQDWTLYGDYHSTNHKESTAIMQELGDATGIDLRSLVAFRPGTRSPREKLQWASTRITTLQEDIAYSLFGIFGVHLPVMYGENKRNALGRLLQEIVAHSGDVSVLDWVGKSSEFNSCLPAEITSYQAPPWSPSLSEDDIQTSVSSLQDAVVVEMALGLYRELGSLRAARFAHRRLHLPCIAFLVTGVTEKPGQNQGASFTYQVNAQGLHDLSITTEDRLTQFWPGRPALQTFYLVRPWNRDLLELPDFTKLPGHAEPPPSLDISQSMEEYCTSPGSPSDDIVPVPLGGKGTLDSESHSRALRLFVRLGRPFSALLLAQQRGGEYKRVASDRVIVAQVKDIASIRDVIDVRTLEIL